MAKRSNESYIEYKKRVIDIASSSFCAAKWYNATIWLESGKTTSCHHPPSHSIDTTKLDSNPALLHNTMLKKVERELMLKGRRPPGCDYCWKVENINSELVSDRVFKTEIYCDEDINHAIASNPRQDFIPKTLEVSFCSTCQLACVYCNSSFSSSWRKDIKSNGHYSGLNPEDSERINHLGDTADLDITKQSNPYITAFWQWWPSLVEHLQEIRVTGGEPLLSSNTWKLIKFFELNNSASKITLAINSNLLVENTLIAKLIKSSHNIQKLDIYTSCEATGKAAEYIRDGMNYQTFLTNCEDILKHANLNSFNVMLTVNILSIYSFTSFLDQVILFKNKYAQSNITVSINILRFPDILSVTNLPYDKRLSIANSLIKWKENNSAQLKEMEIASIIRLGALLRNSKEKNMKDELRGYLKQFDKRRSKNLAESIPQIHTWLYQDE